MRKMLPARRGVHGSGEVEEATLPYLVYGLLPSWFLPGLADWRLHRRSRIEAPPPPASPSSTP